MSPWPVFALLIAGTLAVLLIPILRHPREGAARFEHDVAVWRDQLAEIEREKARGLMSDQQAAQARLEIERRILAAADAAPTVSRAVSGRWTRLIAAAAIVLVAPVGALLLYVGIGNPDLPSRPFAERVNEPDYQMERMADELAGRLAARPDATGFALLGKILTSLGRQSDAAQAWQQAIQAGDKSANAYASLGLALTFSNRDQVGADAQAAFRKALAVAPDEPRARFYLGVARAQAEDMTGALAIWRDLEADSPADAPWRPMLEQQIALVAGKAGIDPATIAPKKP